MPETHTLAPKELETRQQTLAAAIDRMLTLRWPDYADSDHLNSLQAESYHRVTTPSDEPSTDHPNRFGFYINSREAAEFDTPSLEEMRTAEMQATSDACRELAGLLAVGPLGACNAPVAEAFRANIKDTSDVLLAAYSEQEKTQLSPDLAANNHDAGLTLLALQHTLAGLAVQLGAIDRQEAYADFSTQAYPGVMYGAKKLRNNGQANSYGIRYLHEMELTNDDDWQETPTYLDVSATPGQRFACGLRFLSPNLTDRFATDMVTKSGTHPMRDFSIRIDYDDISPSGFSVDVGRDERATAEVTRGADAAGSSIQALRPDNGSHFVEHFDNVSNQDMEEFLSNLVEMLRADAEMDRLDRTLHDRQSLS